MLAGIVLHATMAYLPGLRTLNWPIADKSTSTVLGLAYFVVHIFRMALFFMVAGFFARLLHQRLGTAGLIKNRLRRIGLPFFGCDGPDNPASYRRQHLGGRCRSACTAAHRLAQALPSSVHQFH
ncbi:hypothetical protein MYXE_03120 [Mycobacterium xenopi]|uniref:Uncharacterized protein n=2 Tax=Mycobacterium xenopi TaxID=1789 RepID=A0AAD1GWK6_MYCXE|nr:hypothetical protein MYXE_03120 [Mycobacterium xenopi]